MFFIRVILSLILYIPTVILWILFTMCARLMMLITGVYSLSWCFLDVYAITTEEIEQELNNE